MRMTTASFATCCAAADVSACTAAEQTKLYLNMACKGDTSSKAEVAHVAQIASLPVCTWTPFTENLSGAWANHAFSICGYVYMLPY